jgi:hypothetical protein
MALSWKRWLAGWKPRSVARRARLRRASPLLEALEDRTVLSILIPVTNHRDLVYDPTRGVLDITTSSGTLQQFNVASQTLTPLSVGTSLLGADITADGSALYVAEGQTSSGQGILHKVDLTTGTVTNLSYNLAFGEIGSFDVALGANGKGLFDGSFGGSGFVPLRQVDLATDTLSTRTDDPGIGPGATPQITQNTMIHRSADRSLFFFTESNISSGPIFTYNAQTDTFSHSFDTNLFLSNDLSGVNRNGSLIALEENGGVTVMDDNFNVVKFLPGVTDGVTFDPVHDVLYAVNPSLGQIQAYDTNTWTLKYQMAVGESVGAPQALGNGVMTTSKDGSLLFLATPSGVRMYNLPAPTGNQFVVTGFPTPDTAGAAGSFTVTAEDAQGNVLTNYTGTVHFTSSEATAQLPADYTFTTADAGTHTFSATLIRSGTQSLTATDTASGLTGTEGNIVVKGGAAVSLVFSSAFQGSYTAGGLVNVSIVAKDAYGNSSSGYTGTVHFTSSDPHAQLPFDYTFTAADGGAHSFGAILETAGTQSVTATDTANAALSVTQGLNVVPASTSSFTVTGYPSATTAGVAQGFTVTAYDAFGNLTPLYAGTVHFTSSDFNAALPANYTFTSADQGTHSFSATLKSAGTSSLTVSDPSHPWITGSETGIVVTPAAPSSFAVNLSPDASTAGQALSLTLTVRDPYGNVVTGYTGTVHFTSTDPLASLPADYTFTAADQGTHTFTNGVTLYTVQPPLANAQFVTATDTSNSSITGAGHDFVRPAAASTYQLTVPAAVAAGSPFSVTLTALDPYGNKAIGYTGKVHFSSSDMQAVLPADYTFVSGDFGSHTFTSGATLATLGSQTLTAADAGNGAITATATTTVNPQVQGLHFVVSPSTSSPAAGSIFGVTVTALDGNGNVATGYTGTVTFATSDTGVGVFLPGPYPFTAADAGVHTFSSSVILVSAGSQTIAAFDRGITDGSSASSATVQVSPGAATYFVVSGFPTPIIAGTAGTFTVTAQDRYGNVATGYTGTVHFTSSDLTASLPADYTFTAADGGVHTFSATLKIAATESIAASDTGPAHISGTQLNITVLPSTAAQFAFTLQGPLTAGVAATFMVTALDTYGNEATGYRGTVHFTTSDAKGTVPADYTFTAADNGQHAFSAALILKTAGTQTVTATDTASSSISGTTTQTVVPGPVVLVSAFPTILPLSTTAGQAFTLTAEAQDLYGNIVPSFQGTVFWSTSDHQGTLPGAYTFTSADQGVHTFTNLTTLRTAGWQSVTASWQSGQNSSTSIVFDDVLAAAASRVQMSAPASTTAGAPFSVTVTALDPYGNVATSFTGTAHFSSSDPQASLPADYTFTGADAGSHTFTNGATLDTAGFRTVSVTAGGFSTSSVVKVNTAAVNHFRVAADATSTAGSAFFVTLTALDPFNNLVSNYTGKVHFSSSDPQAFLPPDYTFTKLDAGTHVFVFGAVLYTAGNQTISVADTANASATGSASVAVTPAGQHAFRLAAPATTTAGTPFSLTVTAVDAYGNNTVGDLVGTAYFFSSDPGAAVPANYTFLPGNNGTHTFINGATLVTAGSQSVTVYAPNMLPATASLTVSPAAAASLSLAAPPTTTAGTAFSVTLTAHDAYGNVATGYTGTVHFTSSDPLGTLPGDYTFTSSDAGVHTFTGVILDTAGNQTIAAGDTSVPALTASAQVTVSAAAATHFLLLAPPSSTAGTSFDATLTALDAFNNVATSYMGTVHFSSSDPLASLPGDTTLANGTGTFTVTLKTAGTQWITATDTATSITGTQAGIVVSAAAASTMTVAGFPSPTTAGTSGNFSVTLRDSFGNVAAGYTGTVHFTSSDAQAALPPDYTFTSADAGSHTFAALLETASSQSITVADASAGISGTQAAITVTPAAASLFTVSGFPSPTTAGAAQTLTVTAKDAYGNIATAYAGTVHFTSSDNQAVLPADYTFIASDSGAHAFSVTLETAGTQSVTASDTSTLTLTGSETGIAVNAATASTLAVTGYPTSTTAGVAHTLTVTLRDAYGNIAVGYTGTVHFSSSDPQAGLPADYTFKATDAGVHAFTVTLKTAAAQSITVSDTVTPALTATQSGITVNAAAASTFVLSGYPTSTTAGTAHTFTVTALDAFGNVATGYTGTVHFTSTDAQAGLPSNYTFTAADAGTHTFTVTLKTAGTQSITATDTTTGGITGTQSGIHVTAAAATHFSILIPTNVKAGVAFTITVLALDAYGNVDTNYRGTVHFRSSDRRGILPADYTFTANDAGVHSLRVTLRTTGSQFLIVTDRKNSSITGSGSTTVGR